MYYALHHIKQVWLQALNIRCLPFAYNIDLFLQTIRRAPCGFQEL